MSEVAAPQGLVPGAGISRVLSDDRLVRRAVQGDEHAFAAIFRRYQQPLYRYCAAIVGNAADAEDALQNTMVKAMRALPGEERRIDLKPWLYRIAHNESIELLRRRRETRALDAELPAPGSGLAEEAAARERLRLLLADLEELPERQRGALVMRELAGLDFDQVGAALGTTPAVARQTVYEARLSLRQMDEGREMSCDMVMRALSDGDGRVLRRRDVRAHLRTCAHCRGFGEEIERRERDFAVLPPLPAVAAVGLLQALLGGGQGGGGLAAAVGGGAAKSAGATAALKGAATVAVVAAIGVTAADRGGLIDAGFPGGDGGSQPAQSETRSGTVEAGDGAGSAAAEANHAAAPAGGVGNATVPGTAGTVDPAQAAGAGQRSPAASPTGGDRGSSTAVAPPSSEPSASHPHGRGHEKSLPSAAEHGQQTAAEHKAGPGSGSAQGGGKSKPGGSESASAGTKGGKGSAGHPTHPAHPPKPALAPPPASSGKAPSSDPEPVAPPAEHGNSAAHAGGAEDALPDEP
jgi:RNA polymerase sigma factor (sigma-70 family)